MIRPGYAVSETKAFATSVHGNGARNDGKKKDAAPRFYLTLRFPFKEKEKNEIPLFSAEAPDVTDFKPTLYQKRNSPYAFYSSFFCPQSASSFVLSWSTMKETSCDVDFQSRRLHCSVNPQGRSTDSTSDSVSFF